MSKQANETLIRRATPDDLPEITKLFRETIETINRKDYDPDQIKIWSSGYADIPKWTSRLSEQFFIVALNGNRLTGFSSMSARGYLDTLFVHKDHQNIGIASLLLQELKSKANELKLKRIDTESSITAQPFFEKKGFRTVRKQVIKYKNTGFENFVMELIL